MKVFSILILSSYLLLTVSSPNAAYAMIICRFLIRAKPTFDIQANTLAALEAKIRTLPLTVPFIGEVELDLDTEVRKYNKQLSVFDDQRSIFESLFSKIREGQILRRNNARKQVLAGILFWARHQSQVTEFNPDLILKLLANQYMEAITAPRIYRTGVMGETFKIGPNFEDWETLSQVFPRLITRHGESHWVGGVYEGFRSFYVVESVVVDILSEAR